MFSTSVLITLGAIALGIAHAVLSRRMNPYEELPYEGLPEPVRSELDRIVPGFKSRTARITKKRDQVRVEGELDGETLRVEADLDRAGGLVELEVERELGSYQRSRIDDAELPEFVIREMERVLGVDLPRFERRVALGTKRADVPHYVVKGDAGDWKWEIAVGEDGRLLEVEKERRGRR